MKPIKIILLALVIVSLALLAAIAYFSAITLSIETKALLIAEIEKATCRKVLLQSVRFDTIKGLVLEGPVILYDGASVAFRAREISGWFLMAPILKKKILIPSVKIEDAVILVERRPDNSFGIADLLSINCLSANGVTVAAHRIIIRRGRIDFVDRTLSPPFTKPLEGVGADIRLGPDGGISFEFTGEIPSDLPIKIKSSGRYSLSPRGLRAHVTINDLSLKDFAGYYSDSGVSFPKGAVDAAIDLWSQEDIIHAGIDAQTKELDVSKDRIKARLDSGMKVLASYDVKNRQLKYSGRFDIRGMKIAGVEGMGALEKIKAKVEFNGSRLWSDSVSADAFGMPWKARLNLVNFASPILDIHAVSEIRLSVLKKTLEDNFKIKLPADISGMGEVEIDLQMLPGSQPKLNGYLRMREATIGLGDGKFPIERVNGEAQFTANTLRWEDVGFTYRGVIYGASGVLTNFESPGIHASVKSQDLSFESALAVNDKLIRISRLKGRYLNSPFSVTGRADFTDKESVEADISGTLELDLKDLAVMAKASPGMRGMRPQGTAYAEFKLSGDIKDIRSCDIGARVKSPGASFHGLTFTGIVLDYAQEAGVGRVKYMSSSFYGGAAHGAGEIDLFSKGLAYSANLNMKDVRLEQFKKDTGLKDKDIAGDIKIYASVNGLFDDPSRLTGLGRISITKGRLWELDLFRGLGVFIFTSDFSGIVFTDGSCDFKIRDRVFRTDNFILKSDLVNLYGSAAIDFNKSAVLASLKSELTEEAMDPGARQRIAASIGRYTYIEVSGALAEPKYRLRPSISDAAEETANNFFQQ